MQCVVSTIAIFYQGVLTVAVLYCSGLIYGRALSLQLLTDVAFVLFVCALIDGVSCS